MIDSAMKEQLQTVFAKLENEVSLVMAKSSHTDQAELSSMLTDVASTSNKIKLIHSDETAATPQFDIYYQGKPTGITFRGIPGGHEFTSLILAILNSDGKGKMPEEHIRIRIKNLKKNISVKTFMSLTCENCPDVVQNLNQITLIHGSMTHQVIDGGYAQDEIENMVFKGSPVSWDKKKCFTQVELIF